MIEDPNPTNWKELQLGVCRLLNEIGLNAQTEKILETPRGKVEIDVYAVDENSVDKIKYLIECKNWSSPIPQTVVHSFTTVMREVGANIGFIVSRNGLQAGALDYTNHTNIIGLTYKEFQARYFETWYIKYFVPKIGDKVDALTQYVEPINGRRDRFVDSLPDDGKARFYELFKRYQLFGMFVAFFEFSRYSSQINLQPLDIDQLKLAFRKQIGDEFAFSSIYYRDLLSEIVNKVTSVTDEFHNVFGKNIFL